MADKWGPNNPPPGWRGHPELSKEAVKTRWAYPQLFMHIYAGMDGMRVSARVEFMGEDGRLVCHTIARATWAPKEVSERLVVEWGRRALAAWLESHLEPTEG